VRQPTRRPFPTGSATPYLPSMTRDEATSFIRPAVRNHPGDWADLGAGSGTFTAALAHLLGSAKTVTTVERDPRRLHELRTLANHLPAAAATVNVIDADLERPGALASLQPDSLAGVLFGNVLHYFADPLPLIRNAATKLRPGGAIVVLEYEGARANPWVPYPLSLSRLAQLAEAAGLDTPDVVTETTSRYHGTLYCAVLRTQPPAQ
jgi:SAM-dependent methyltransferase